MMDKLTNNSVPEQDPNLVNERANWGDFNTDELREAEAADDAYSTQDRSKNRGIMILLATGIVGMLGVYFFGARQQPNQPSEQEKAIEAKVDVALAKLVNEGQTRQLMNDTGKMVETFYEYPASQQVSLDDLQKNPFSRLSDAELKAGDSNKTQAQLEREMSRLFKDLELQSVIQSSRGTKCLINGKIFSEGQMIEDVFKIKTITSDRVVLDGKGVEFTLQI